MSNSFLHRLPVFGSYLLWLREGTSDRKLETLPLVSEKYETSLKGVYLAGDLSGIPLLKFASRQGSSLVRELAENKTLSPQRQGVGSEEKPFELLIVGGGVAGVAAYREAKSKGIQAVLLEASRLFSTLANFPEGKPIILKEENDQDLPLPIRGDSKEALLEHLDQLSQDVDWIQARVLSLRQANQKIEVLTEQKSLYARTVILALGRSGNHRKLNVTGENLSKVNNRLINPKDYSGQQVAVVGGGDRAIEAAIALYSAGAEVDLIHRGSTFAKARSENQQALQTLLDTGRIRLHLKSEIKAIFDWEIELDSGLKIKNQALFTMIGQEMPLDFFKRSGIKLEGAWSKTTWFFCLLSLLVFYVFYAWKKGWLGAYSFDFISRPIWFSCDAPFIYGALYSLLVVIFGIKRILRVKTPYVFKQTLILSLIQILPLWLLPTIILPWLDFHDLLPVWFKIHVLGVDADSILTGGQCWRAYGFILAWPLFPFNQITQEPMPFWLAYGFLQTFVIIPWLIVLYGKGAYCGFICSCGALAETVGDSLRRKTPHGPFWKNLEDWGQVILLVVSLISLIQFFNWIPGLHSAGLQNGIHLIFEGYVLLVDFFLASVLAIGLYVFLGGRVWCRFFCPLAALMNVYGRFSRFRIFADAKKCISCEICSKVCHQGIDVMSYANQGRPMSDPQCVRCSACISSCPTQVLSFGALPRK